MTVTAVETEVDARYEAWLADRDYTSDRDVDAGDEEWRADRGGRFLWKYGFTEGEMAVLRRDGPYIWVTWLTRLLVGESSCEWASWFRSQHDGKTCEKVPSDFDGSAWMLAHTQALTEYRHLLETQDHTVFTEGQNSFTLRGSTATLGGKPDLVAKKGSSGIIVDVKTGKPSPSHSVQVMLYMYAVPRALGQYKGMGFDGKVVYEDHEVDIPASAVDETFISNVSDLIGRLAASSPARKVPSVTECRFCDITKLDCPERLEDALQEGTTEDF